MSLAIGSRLGPYEIVAPLGAGGMGEVYRARDSKLNRDVAIKVLPPAFAEDPERMARFEREAQVLAALNHPNIAQIYGIEQGALIMELVEGEDLHGPVPIETALDYARQIAAGLEAAHEKGIIHRDLKPANIKVTGNGTVKLLDFGLAKAGVESAAVTGQSPTQSPTLSLAMTQAGVILGTAAYMSPEQARGKPVDKRADIWAFGVVLYEMLTGRLLFGGGETVTDTLASVVKEEPDWSALPGDTPPRVRRLLERCLRKDSKTRLQAIGEARIAIDEPEPEPSTAAVPASVPRRNWVPWAAAGAFALLALGLAVAWLRHPAEETQTFKVSVLPPEKGAFLPRSLPSVSPDGRHLAFAAAYEGKRQLWIRDLDALAARPIPGTDEAIEPFWSPDSRFVAFFADGKLKKVDITGGPALTLCDAAGAGGRGGSWSKNDVIVFTPSVAAGLFRVPAAGGTATPLTAVDRAAGETSHRFPWFLPDGRHFLFTVRAEQQKSAIYVGDLESKDRRQLVAAACNAAYSPPGFLLFLRERTLMAQPFDAAGLRTTGEPFPIAEEVDYIEGQIQAQFAVSQTGVLAFYAGGLANHSQLTWLDRGGKSLGTVGPPGNIREVAISPDGATVAMARMDPQMVTTDIWFHDLVHGTDSRFTFDHTTDEAPVWSPDGSRILFASIRTGKSGIYQKLVTGAGKEVLLCQTASLSIPTDWSRDGRFAIFENIDAHTRYDVWVLPLSGDRKPFPFLQTESRELNGKLSPDGRWLAYQSDETGRPEVYVQTFPGQEGKWQVSATGGTRPVWRRDGKELFFISADDRLMAVDVKSGVRFEHGVPKPLFEARTPSYATFDVSRDGKRFLMANLLDQGATQAMTVVINWQAGLKR